MAINNYLHKQWQELQQHSIAKAVKRYAYDPKGQTLTRAERKRAKAREAYERQCLANE